MSCKKCGETECARIKKGRKLCCIHYFSLLENDAAWDFEECPVCANNKYKPQKGAREQSIEFYKSIYGSIEKMPESLQFNLGLIKITDQGLKKVY